MVGDPAQKGTGLGQHSEVESVRLRVALLCEVRWALRHLYAPGELRRSDLVRLLELTNKHSASSLQRILLDAVDAVRPGPNVPPQSRAWRAYQALFHRYVEQFSQGEVAKTMGLSIRQVRREETAALRILCDYLWTHYDLSDRSLEDDPVPEPTRDSTHTVDQGGPSRDKELQWLGTSLSKGEVAIGATLEAALGVVSPLLRSTGVQVECFVPEGLPHLAVEGSTLRQALVSVFTASAYAARGGRIRISVERRQQQVYVTIRLIGGLLKTESFASDRAEGLEMAGQLTALAGGTMQPVNMEAGAGLSLVELALPIAEQLAVLLIDDNADTLQLFQRYLVGTRYPAVGVRDPQRALILAETLQPLIIVLDVMLPGIDGWELMGRLREDPMTCGIPVIICTILPGEELALTLGAASFIRKPVNRADFLAALDRQSGLLASISAR